PTVASSDTPAVQPVKAGTELPLWAKASLSADELRVLLLDTVPEVALEANADAPKDAKEARQKIQKQGEAIASQIKDDPDAFVQQLVDQRPDLAGLPWRKGKDCRLDKDQAAALQAWSRAVRGGLDASMRYPSGSAPRGKAPDVAPDDVYKDAGLFWSSLG